MFVGCLVEYILLGEHGIVEGKFSILILGFVIYQEFILNTWEEYGLLVKETYKHTLSKIYLPKIMF